LQYPIVIVISTRAVFLRVSEGIKAVCEAYDKFHNNSPPIPTHYLREILSLILKENSFQFNGRNYLQIYGTAMGTKMAVAFANIFMSKIETQILSKTVKKPTVWKRYIDDIFSLWDASKTDIERFIEQANSYHSTTKFTIEISNTETTFLDTVIYKGERFREQSILDIKTDFKPTETFQYTHQMCRPPNVKKVFIKGEALRLLRTKVLKCFRDVRDCVACHALLPPTVNCSHAVHNLIRVNSMTHRCPQNRISDRPSQQGLRPLPLSEQYVGSLTSHASTVRRGLRFYRPYPRRLESLTTCRCHYKGSTFSSVI